MPTPSKPTSAFDELKQRNSQLAYALLDYKDQYKRVWYKFTTKHSLRDLEQKELRDWAVIVINSSLSTGIKGVVMTMY